MWFDEEKAVAAFRTGNGVAWGDHDDRLYCGVSAFYRNAYSASLVKEWLPALTGVTAKLEAGAEVADVGCGYGRSLGKLQQRFAPKRLIGMDIDPEMLEASAAEVAGLGIAAEFVCCSSSNIKLPDNSVDLLFCHQTFHHLVEQDEALREFMRVLKPGGILVVADWISGTIARFHSMVGKSR